MIGVTIFGSGRMGAIYAAALASSAHARLVSVVNPNLSSAERLVAQHGGVALRDPDAALADPSVDAVIITTPTDTHLEFIQRAVSAGKAILCEKPLDLSLDRVDACVDLITESDVAFMLGFNRRFDPGVGALREAVDAGDVGKLNILMLTSRDPAPPPLSYIRTSGGYWADSTVHDIDLACWIAGEQPVKVFATGSCLVDPGIGEAGDVDTSMTILKMPSGCLVHINNSRRAVYGFDQRIEAFGDAGMIQAANLHEDNLLHWDSKRTKAKAPLEHFFLERYARSFQLALEAFVLAVGENNPPTPTASDGHRALAIALACEDSRRRGCWVRPQYRDYGSAGISK
ncbi:inositol 2-dehydrogenase [Thioclava sp. 15-R06ZXC-3]|uniref:Inositol 2-dehydrogenase n=1 Tax=Thioclava arctica TaxID=3238301 RepID=A0ABV3TQS3_9RHOB